eukprot:Skav214554  [mRNA]  locus=scaffold410:881632:881910:+ [translate_table: standard]
MAVKCFQLFLCVLAACMFGGESSNTSGFLAPIAPVKFPKNSTADAPNTALGSKFGGDKCYDNCLLSFHDCNKDPSAFTQCSSRLSACYSNCR